MASLQKDATQSSQTSRTVSAIFWCRRLAIIPAIGLMLMLVPVMSLSLSVSARKVAEQKAELSHDVAGLERLITLPYQPVRVSWVVRKPPPSRVPGPTDWYLVALIEFRPKDLRRIVARSHTVPSAVMAVDDADAALLGIATESAGHELSRHEGVLFEKSPLLSGYFIRLNGNRIVLTLGTT